MKTLLCLSMMLSSMSVSAETKNYLTSIGELCESSHGCKIELVPKTMNVVVANRSLLLLDSKYNYVAGGCVDKTFCKIVIQKL